jgi:2-oxoglutarate dehydrogenase E2 component (dihydrolipoamide succinyltransferase)
MELNMEIKIPEVGESVIDALVAKWHMHDGGRVTKDEPVCEIETDKITMEINAEADGILKILIPEGTTVKIGTVIGTIEEAGTGDQGPGTGKAKTAASVTGPANVTGQKPAPQLSPSERKATREKIVTGDRGTGTGKQGPGIGDRERRVEEKAEGKAEGKGELKEKAGSEPSLSVKTEEPAPYGVASSPDARITRKPMTPIRKRIAERLSAARRETAMLTTFNEADMGRVMELRRKYGEEFLKKHGVKLGFMSFFVKACCEALREFAAVNARIDGDDIVYHDYCDIGIAMSGEKGLVAPVLRDAGRLHFAEIERAIDGFMEKIRTNRLAISDLEGGTFTITNGGIFGSLMSTPILNPPQSGVLGMHAIQERPVARDGQVVIRPMMYLALSYDHRVIDGREAVLFLKKVKEYIEEPEEMLLEG